MISWINDAMKYIADNNILTHLAGFVLIGVAIALAIEHHAAITPDIAGVAGGLLTGGITLVTVAHRNVT